MVFSLTPTELKLRTYGSAKVEASRVDCRMKRLLALKENFDKGQMGEREFLHERNALIFSSTDELMKDAPNKKIEELVAALKELVDLHIPQGDTTTINWSSMKEFSAVPFRFVEDNKRLIRARLRNAGWSNKLLAILRDLLIETVCNKALVYTLGALRYVSRVVASPKAHEKIRNFGITFLWIYGELDVHRRQLVSEGGWDALFGVAKSGPHDLVVNASGVLWGLTEYEEIQELFVANDLHILFDSYVEVALSGTPIEGPFGYEINVIEDDDLLRFMGCIHLVSCNENCAKKLADFADSAVKLAENTEDLMIAYFSSFSFRRLVVGFGSMCGSFNGDVISPRSKIGIQTFVAIARFVREQSYLDLIAREEADSYTWRSMKPFTKLLKSKFSEIYQLGMMALANLVERLRVGNRFTSGISKANRGILDDEGDEDMVIAHAMFPRVRIEPKPAKDLLATNKAILGYFHANQPPPLSLLVELSQLPSCQSAITSLGLAKDSNS